MDSEYQNEKRELNRDIFEVILAKDFPKLMTDLP